MAKLTVRDISLQGTFTVDILQKLSLKAAVNNHAVLKYSGIIDNIRGLRLVEQETAGQKMRLYLEDKLVFCGTVTTVEVSEENSMFYLSVSCFDNTCLIDIAPHHRSFQNVGTTYAEMLEQVYNDCGSASIITINGKEAIGLPILQYGETDWQFTLRMAGKLGTLVVPNLASENAQAAFGFPKGNRFTITTTRYLIERRNVQYIRRDEEYTDTHFQDFLQYSVCDDRVFSLGDRIEICGYSLAVTELFFSLNSGMLENEYVLGTERGFCQPLCCNERQAGITLPGTVLAASGQTVKLHLDIDEKQDAGCAFNFPYAPQTNNGMYCMPEVGTRVMLRWNSEQDGDAVGVHCCRENGQECEELGNYNNRYLTTDDGKRLAMLPEALLFSGGSNRVKVTNSSGIGVQTANEVTLSAGNNIRLSSRLKVIFVTPEQLKIVKSGVKSGIDVSGGQMHVLSKKVTVHGDLSKKIVEKAPVIKRKAVIVNNGLITKTAGLVPAAGGKIQDGRK